MQFSLSMNFLNLTARKLVIQTIGIPRASMENIASYTEATCLLFSKYYTVNIISVFKNNISITSSMGIFRYANFMLTCSCDIFFCNSSNIWCFTINSFIIHFYKWISYKGYHIYHIFYCIQIQISFQVVFWLKNSNIYLIYTILHLYI